LVVLIVFFVYFKFAVQKLFSANMYILLFNLYCKLLETQHIATIQIGPCQIFLIKIS